MGGSWSNRKVIITVWSTRWTTKTTILFAIEMVGVQGGECEKALWYPSVQGIIINVIRCHSNRIILEIITCCYWISIDPLTLYHWLTPKEQKGRIFIMNILHMLRMIRAGKWPGHMCGRNISPLEKKVWHWITNSRAHGTLLSAMWQPGWKESSGENEYIYICGWVALLTTRSYHNIVNQLCC